MSRLIEGEGKILELGFRKTHVQLVDKSDDCGSSGSSTTVTNSTTIGNPEYLRLAGNGEVNINLGRTNETFTFPAIWKVNYGH